MSLNENFNFETSAFVSYVMSGLTDGTTTPQNLGTLFTAFAHNGGSSLVFAEPEKIIGVGNEHLNWDKLTRMILITQRQSGTGTWTGALEHIRDGGTLISIATGIDFPIASSAAQITVIDNPLGHDFGTDGTPLLVDEIRFLFKLTAIGEAVAANVMALMILVPGFVAAGSNKGAVLSANQFLGNS